MPDATVITLVLGLLALLAVWFVRTPKEASSELQQRVAMLEGTVSTLRSEYAGNHGRHDEALRSLTAAMNRLADRIDRFETAIGIGKQNGPGRRG